jgi:hypothetical protein
MKASEIITKARFTLSDTDKSRWSDDRLLSSLNDALLDIALTTELYNACGYIELTDNISVYDASSFAIKLDRAEHINKPLVKLSFEEMDRCFRSGWQDVTGETPTHIVYNLKRSGEFIIYPKPVNNGAFIARNTDFGIVTNLTYEDMPLEVTGNFGDLDPPDLTRYIKLYYISAPAELKTIDDDLEPTIARSMLSCLAHYITGSALRDNMDAHDRQVGNEELSLYESKKQKLAEQKIDGSVKRIRVATYRGFG